MQFSGGYFPRWELHGGGGWGGVGQFSYVGIVRWVNVVGDNFQGCNCP